jgi:hypothetical protein
MSTITVEQMNKHVEAIRAKEAEYEEAKKISSALGAEVDRLYDQAGQMLLELGQSSFKTPLGTISIKKRVSFQTPKDEESREAFFSKLKEMGVFDSMITVNSNTLNSFLKAEYEAAEARGEDMITYRFAGIQPPKVSVTASLRKA